MFAVSIAWLVRSMRSTSAIHRIITCISGSISSGRYCKPRYAMPETVWLRAISKIRDQLSSDSGSDGGSTAVSHRPERTSVNNALCSASICIRQSVISPNLRHSPSCASTSANARCGSTSNSQQMASANCCEVKSCPSASSHIRAAVALRVYTFVRFAEPVEASTIMWLLPILRNFRLAFSFMILNC